MTSRLDRLRRTVFTGDYKAQFKAIVDEMVESRTEDLKLRMKEIDVLCETYTRQIGEKPDGSQLLRLSNLILWEELEGNKNKDKVKKSKTPVLTSPQLQRRRSYETSDIFFNTIAANGRRFHKPTRRINREAY